MESKEAYSQAVKAQNTASSMLPRDRAGWKYTVIVATMCFPSCLPRKFDSAGTKVAILPKRYAKLHLKTPFPISEVRKALTRLGKVWTACQRSRTLAFVSEILPFRPRNSGDRSSPRFEEVLLGEGLRLGLPLRLMRFLDRSPVCGRIRVEFRIYQDK